MFDWPRLNKLVAWRLLGLVEQAERGKPSLRSDWPLAVRIIDQILRAALPGVSFLIHFEVAAVAIVCAPSWPAMVVPLPAALRTEPRWSPATPQRPR